MKSNLKLSPKKLVPAFAGIVLVLVGLMLTSCSKENSVAPLSQLTAQDQSTALSRTDCFDVPPEALIYIKHGDGIRKGAYYTLMVEPCGKVTYHGIANVPVVGTRVFTITTHHAYELADVLKNNGRFYELSNLYPDIPNMPKNLTALRYNWYALKAVTDYGLQVPVWLVLARNQVIADLGINRLVHSDMEEEQDNWY